MIELKNAVIQCHLVFATRVQMRVLKMTIEEIRKNAPDGAQKYRVNADGSVEYFKWKNNEGMQWWSTWCWLGVNTYGMELKPL